MPIQSLELVLETAQSNNPREVQDVVNKFGAGEDFLSKMVMAEQPRKLKTPPATVSAAGPALDAKPGIALPTASKLE